MTMFCWVWDIQQNTVNCTQYIFKKLSLKWFHRNEPKHVAVKYDVYLSIIIAKQRVVLDGIFYIFKSLYITVHRIQWGCLTWKKWNMLIHFWSAIFVINWDAVSFIKMLLRKNMTWHWSRCKGHITVIIS
jgi:hypothetical protein